MSFDGDARRRIRRLRHAGGDWSAARDRHDSRGCPARFRARGSSRLAAAMAFAIGLPAPLGGAVAPFNEKSATFAAGAVRGAAAIAAVIGLHRDGAVAPSMPRRRSRTRRFASPAR
ncbi:hypothetical protein C7S16_5364 [Burkholderia thailandensis]|uniref:Uncharacterized protein n=2 Tax=Burkholderia thailandensis TaxID=57975 RepID=A0AAW9CQF3_BURTH|nr:hypothetical protein [Burkholderia thailandensis]